MNEPICFVCFFAFHGKQNKFICSFFGRIYGTSKLQTAFGFIWSLSKRKNLWAMPVCICLKSTYLVLSFIKIFFHNISLSNVIYEKICESAVMWIILGQNLELWVVGVKIFNMHACTHIRCWKYVFDKVCHNDLAIMGTWILDVLWGQPIKLIQVVQLFIFDFWSSQFSRLLWPCRNEKEWFWRKQFSCKSEMEATWISLIG